MNFKSTIAIVLFTFFMGMLFGYLFRGSPEHEVIEKNVRTYVPDLKLPDIMGPELEFKRQYRFIHTTKVDTVEKKIYVPIQYNDEFYITEKRPLSISDGDIQFRYFDPATRKEGIDEYNIREQALDWGLYADTFWPVDNLFQFDYRPMVGLRASVDVKRVRVHLGTYYSVYDKQFGAMTGVSIKLLSRQ